MRERSSMPRAPRIEVENGVYHVTARATFGGSIFGDDSDRATFLRLLGATVRRQEWRCLGYSLLSTHYHLIVKTPLANLARGMQYLNGVYGQVVNRERRRHGHLFSERYSAERIERDEHLLATVRYVARNAVVAGICARPEDYRWCSHRAVAGFGIAPAFLATNEILALFGPRRDRARERYCELVSSGTSQMTPSGGKVTSAEYGRSFQGLFAASIPQPFPTSEPP